MGFWPGLVHVYVQSWRLLWALPILATAIFGFEAAQHTAEWFGGMYGDRAGLLAAAHAQGRLIAGSIKVLWLLVVQFWVIRYIVLGSADLALRPSTMAVRAFGLVFLLSAAFALIGLWLPEGFPTHARSAAGAWSAIVQLITFPLGIALTPWLVGAATGDRRAGPLFALRRAWGSIWWGVAFSLAAVIPLMALHYLLNLGAVGRPPVVSIPMLVIDAAVVSFLGVVIAASAVPIAERMAVKAGDVLAGA